MAKKPTWTDVKRALADFDTPGLLGVIQDLYAARKENQTFLHARFGLGGDVLASYKKELDRWLSPDVTRDQDVSFAKARQAISDYRKAAGDPAGLAELLVYYCELATGFSTAYGYSDAAYFDALVRMCEKSLAAITLLPEAQRESLIARLDAVREESHDFGYWVGERLDDLFAAYEIG